MTRFIDSRGWKRKVRFSRKLKYIWGKKIHSLSCLTRVYLCAKIETIWVFDPCHKNFIFVWFLHGCPLNSFITTTSGTTAKNRAFFLIINTTRGHMFTGKWCAPNLIWDHVTENDLLLRPRSHMRSYLKSPVCSKCKLCFSESVIKTDTVSLEELHQRIFRDNQWFVRSFQLSRLRHHNI